jgi:hypothetical protein
MRRICRTLCALAALAFPPLAAAGGGTYALDGGTPAEHAQVRSALAASSFDWSLVPAVTIHLVPGGRTFSTPGEIWLDARLLDQGRFAWATVQHEYGHQVDFFLLDDAKRATLNAVLGGRDWCYGVAGLAHSDYGCERFASTLAWAYWPSRDNTLRPLSRRDEAGAVAPARFRALLAVLLETRPTQGFAAPVTRVAALDP